MGNLKWQLVSEWEKEHGKQFPTWANIWHYDAYGECWEVVQWHEVKDFYESERKEPIKKNEMWKFYYEPMVCLPTDEYPKWGEGVQLKREAING